VSWGLSLAAVLSLVLLCHAAARADDAADEAKSIYGKKCAVCHGQDGAAHTAKGRKSKTRDVRSPEAQKLSDQEWFDIIVKGKGDNMDSYRKDYTDDQIHALVQYMRQLAKEPPKS
jgi:mono/diheme cytochrome c family protein